MADIKVTGEANFTSVTTGMQKIGKDADNLKRKVDRMGGGKSGHQRGGMGVLEISRGVEDFAVAGMRGLLNNIPGIIMSLGGGMGLAGAVSLAAVAETVLGEGLMNMMTNAEAVKKETEALNAANEKYASGLTAAAKKMDDYRIKQAAMLAEQKNAARMAETFRRFGDPTGNFDRKGKATGETRAAEDSINALKSDLAKIGGGDMPKPIDILGNVADDAGAASKLIADLIKQRSEVEREMDKAANKGMGDFAAKMHDMEAALAFAERESARHKANMETAAAAGSKMGESARRTLMEMEDRRAKGLREQMAALEQSKGFNDAEIKSYRDKLDTIDKEIQAAETSEQSAKNRLEYAKQEADLRKKIEARTAINAERSRFGDALQKGIERQSAMMEAFSGIDSILSGMRINGGDLLSSKGKIGGSATEFNSAIQTINYQRESLKELRTIARNTAKNRVATYQ
jgi:G:T/U-mismatch repair DNA glycosylase